MGALQLAANLLMCQQLTQQALNQERTVRKAGPNAPLPILQMGTMAGFIALVQQHDAKRIAALLAQLPAANDEATAPVEPEPTAA